MPNALASEKSPYLRQHADNPVHWLPWGEPAFARARAEQKPVFLSIGYSTCHWCHVMAHESFENPAIADILNEHFVSIKVDREERPDVDRVYMAYVQAMSGHGGWPLSAWLTPDLKPFFGGTYFPPEERQGRPGFPGILLAIARGWREDRARLIAEGERVIAALHEFYDGRQGAETAAAGAEPAEVASLAEQGLRATQECWRHLNENFDATNGGFGGAPKFPRAANLNFLFRVAVLPGLDRDVKAETLRMATATLRAMARGGIHDHVGGGFHRYTVDEAWFVPHFEKMLYDQAQIVVNCLEARQATGDERHAWLARDILTYTLRDLQSPGGGFFTAEDADSARPGAPGQAEPAHAEGAFYVWAADELREVLGDDAGLIAAHFGIGENGNVPAALDPHGEFRGLNILAQRRPLADTAQRCGLTLEEANDKLVAGLERLRVRREARPRPHRDEKILTGPNGLMLSALARAHGVLERPVATASEPGDYLRAALRAATFLQGESYDSARNVLYRSWLEGRGAVEGFPEDYAFLIQGLIDLYEACFDLRWLQWALRLQEKMDEAFWDSARGGYFNSAVGDGSIVLRLKDDYDGAEPAASSVAAMNLLRLAALIEPSGQRGTEGGSESLHGRGIRCLEAFRPQWSQTPHALPQMLCAFEHVLAPPRQVVLVGNPDTEAFRALAAVLTERLGGRRAVIGLPEGTGSGNGEVRNWWSERAPWTREMRAPASGAAAYVCENFTCRMPVNGPDELRQLLHPPEDTQ